MIYYLSLSLTRQMVGPRLASKAGSILLTVRSWSPLFRSYPNVPTRGIPPLLAFTREASAPDMLGRLSIPNCLLRRRKLNTNFLVLELVLLMFFVAFRVRSRSPLWSDARL